MDGNRGGSGDEQTGPNGPNLTQNPFDPAALLGYSPYAAAAAAAAAASTGVFPHMSSAFSLFPPPSAMFPTSSALPFGGLGSLGDPGLLSAATPGLDSTAGRTDWWRMAAARTQLAADQSSSAGIFTPGLSGGGLASPLLGSMFSGLVTTTSCSTTVSSPAAMTQSSPASSATSHADKCDPAARQYASPSTPVSATGARRSKTSTPVQKVKNEAKLNRDADASPRRSTVRRDSLSSTSSVDRLEHAPTTSTAGVKSQSECPSLESSLLSAEAAMYASSSLFFPFALPHLLGASSAGLPFPGLLPPVSSTSTSTSALDVTYSPPCLLPPPPQLSDDHARPNGSSSKTSASSPHVAGSPSRARPARSSRDGERPESRGSRPVRSVIVSPTSSLSSDSELQPPLLPSTLSAARNSAERKPRDVSSWCPSQPSSSLRQSPTHKRCSN